MAVRSARIKIFAFAACLYAVLVLVSVYTLVIKRDALRFHTRDYNYFIEQAARLTDPQMRKELTLQIEGYNLFGLQGLEGVKSLYHAIHTEYFRYTYALLYGLFHDTLPIYLFYSLIFFSPILYYALIQPLKASGIWQPALLFAAMYALLPATLPSVTADLRPRMLFAAAWCLAALAVQYRRPFIEKLLFFGLLLSIREEGILLGAILIALNFLRMQGLPGRWKQTLVLLALDLAALAAFAAFMAWGGYNRVDPLYDPRAMLSRLLLWQPALSLAGVLLAVAAGFLWLRKRGTRPGRLYLAVYSAALLLAGIPALRDTLRWYELLSQERLVTAGEVYLQVVGSAATGLVFYIGILLLALLLDRAHGRHRRILLGAVAALCVVFAATTLAVTPRQVAEWRQNLAPARLVWEFKAAHDRYRTDVLLDYDTYQAFYDYDRVIVYNRLPVWDALPERRIYPENKQSLARLIRERMEYAVIARSSLPEILQLAQMASVPAVEVAGNTKYVILKFEGGVVE